MAAPSFAWAARCRRLAKDDERLPDGGAGPHSLAVVAPLDPDGRYHSRALPGFWLRPAWLWQDPLPSPVALMTQIAPDALRAAVAGQRTVASG